jgi:phosphate transport system protein
MLADSIKAFATRDAALAMELGRRDLVPDAINDDLFHAVIARIQTNPADAPTDVQALFVGKSLERIGDHATNIADEARFLVRGDTPSATRAR